MPTDCLLRATFMRKGHLIGAFFLHSNDSLHIVWTFDPRVQPCLSYFKYDTRSLLIERYNELIAISRDNGWTVAFAGQPNNARLS